MKISMERGALLKAVSQAQSVVERRNTIPILANVLIEAEGETAQFRATDLDIEVVDKTLAQVERAGATTVSAVTLHEIVASFRMALLSPWQMMVLRGGSVLKRGAQAFRSRRYPKKTSPSWQARNMPRTSRRLHLCCADYSTKPNSPSRPKKPAIT